MRNTIKYTVLVLIAVLAMSSCSRKKDRFLSRNWHALNTKYNVLYNGNVALENGLNTIASSYRDNFWETLPVERLNIPEAFEGRSEQDNPDFDRAEEKAVKAVQTHGMNIKGKEKNPQIDEAYLLLGKSRYYSGRFIPALEAFNYILFKYPASSIINDAKIWRAKTNLRLNNEAIALENLNKLLTRDDLSKDNQIQASATLAQLFINRGVLDSAMVYLKSATELTKNNAFKGRLYFIEGQLYNQKAEQDSAQMAFQNVIDLNRKVPRAYRINAMLEQINNFNYDKGDLETLNAFLSSIETNRENRPFLDRIHFTIANHHRTLGNDSLAVVYHNKSLRTDTEDERLKAKNHHAIADIYFNASAYTKAGSYYDSTLIHYPKNTKPYRAVKKRLDNLQDVILYESIAQINDSILRLTTMSDEDIEVFFNNIISRLKKAQEQKQQKQSKNGLTVKPNISTTKSAGGFYFYQPTTVAFGQSEFVNLWGERPLEDNWRWSNKTIASAASTNTASDSKEEQSQDILTTAYYKDQIPKDPAVIDSLAKARNFAYYQLGLIYKNKFKDYDRSREKLEFLLNQPLEERLVLPVQYNLYKVYELLFDEGSASEIKQQIIVNYPQSRYAQILQNPSAVLEADEQSPKARYQALYKLFEDNQYQQVIDGSEVEISRFEGDEMVSKFELLKASAIGRLYGYTQYNKSLNYIALNYPNSSEGKQASELLLDLTQRLSNSSFEGEDISRSFKTVYEFRANEKDTINAFVASLNEAIEEEEVLNLKVSKDVYDLNTTFVVVHGLKSINGARGFAQLLKIDKAEILSKPSFAISSRHYTTLQIHKNLDQYMGWINK